jgi:prevent-host-death family protein
MALMPTPKEEIMKEMTITEFRAKCSAIFSRVQRTKKPVRITRRGTAIAEIVPLDPFRAGAGSGQ